MHESVLRKLESKEGVIQFLRSVQKLLRNTALDLETGTTSQSPFAQWSIYRCLEEFERSVALEGRLRSNANYALMLDNFVHHLVQGAFS